MCNHTTTAPASHFPDARLLLGLMNYRAAQKVALVRPWANATTQMRCSYQGVPPIFVSPLQTLRAVCFAIAFANGTPIGSTDTGGFAATLQAARGADVVYAGGIDDSVEAEGHDRMSIAWPGNQPQLVKELAKVGKPLVML
ncbi:glycoside hydrolase family 3 C-terminal domain-containing protein [Phanerochaete sordida]|uniref:Glycoside hydrolase family 3 C-terminal domain-containing protein n=1 Tax=Phanerochaete sordida TaxID=48140 RepID=A0A9P3G8F3_9APHY|nr:glycoside hydrolase family 3 C-terminal domain-containing protein [Phanerochaete sordida]